MPPIDPRSEEAAIIIFLVGFLGLSGTYAWAAGKARKSGREFNQRMVPLFLALVATATIGASIFPNHGIVRVLIAASALMIAAGAVLTLCSSRYRESAFHRHQYDGYAPTVAGAVSAMYGPEIVNRVTHLWLASVIAATPFHSHGPPTVAETERSAPPPAASTLVSELDVTAARPQRPTEAATTVIDNAPSSPDLKVARTIFPRRQHIQHKVIERGKVLGSAASPVVARPSAPQAVPATVPTPKAGAAVIANRVASANEDISEKTAKLAGTDLSLDEVVPSGFDNAEARFDSTFDALPLNARQYTFDPLKVAGEITPTIPGLHIPNAEVPSPQILTPTVVVHR